MDYYNTNIRRYLIKYGTDLTNHIMKMVNSVDGRTSYDFFDDFRFFYYLFPKVNFYDKKIILDMFMDDFDKTHKEYYRIKKMFEYISKSLCGIRKNFLNMNLTLINFCEDLEGFDRIGDYYELKEIDR